MIFAADELVAPGGPSAPVWAFLTAICVGILGVLAQQIAAKREAKQVKEAAQQTQQNTTSISNGFVGRMDRKLDSIQDDVTETNNRLARHLEWHMEQDK